MFVVLEGIDACGKSTQAKLLADGLDAEMFSFPDYETPIGRLILNRLESGWRVIRTPRTNPDSSKPFNRCVDESQADAVVFQSLNIANKLELQPSIGLALAENRNVVCDRYIGSGLAYGAADNVDRHYLNMVQQSLIQPDVNILVDIDVSDSIDRRPDRRDRYESNQEFMEKVNRYYRIIWEEMSSRTHSLKKDTVWVMVDGRGGPEETYDQIWSSVLRIHGMRSGT